MKSTGDVLHWQSYACGCTSPALADPSKLPARCPKHDGEVLQKYISNKVRNSVEQVEDLSPRAGVAYQNQIKTYR